MIIVREFLGDDGRWYNLSGYDDIHNLRVAGHCRCGQGSRMTGLHLRHAPQEIIELHFRDASAIAKVIAAEEQRTLPTPGAHRALSSANQFTFRSYSAPALIH